MSGGARRRVGAAELLSAADSIAVIAHVHPDADTIARGWPWRWCWTGAASRSR
ncbi:hypothetical protein I551_8614 [Mycobacterium ulcerans str. Harvey]|uniref:Uncharacterized protein n=1 Tax=Mycobacterium ulcerans str. Harvey TaxID=1299332 RepID=A0ABN0RAV6_MYCUL|nr:hypothetical protein I551_8614 [Mycobacterium ulcerans str. Harvey]